MVTALDVVHRAETGVPCRDKDFDLRIVYRTVSSLIKEHKIRYDPQHPVLIDDDLADDIFEAGFRLALATGVLCRDTERIIKFDEKELKKSVGESPSMLNIGDGKDRVEMRFRGIESNVKPVVAGGGAGMPVSESLYTKILASFVKEPLVDTFGGSLTLTEVYGRPMMAGSPLEVLLVKREIELAKEALNIVGRQGIHVIMGGGGVTALGSIAACSTEGGFRKSDGFLIGVLPELKTDYVRLAVATHLSSYGGISISLVEPVVGYIGGPEASAIIGVAEILLSSLVYGVKYHLFGPVNMRYPSASTNRECLWVENVVGQAISRNTRMLITNNVITAAGPCTDMVLYETAATVIGNVPSGWHIGPGVGAASTKYMDRSTGLETRFMAECAVAAMKMSRSNADEIVNVLLSKYESKLKDPPLGKTFPECYDLKTLTPSSEWLRIYRGVKGELKDLGIGF